jgi:hypothetical protein
MAITPLLGEVAEAASKAFVSYTVSNGIHELMEESEIADDAIVVCGFGSIGKEILYALGTSHTRSDCEDKKLLPQIVAFDTEPSLIDKILIPMDNTAVLFGNGENPEVLRHHGVENPRAIFISYEEEEQVMAATTRLRTLFADTPIYTRAPSRKEAEDLKAAGATEVVVEHDELARSARSLLQSTKT